MSKQVALVVGGGSGIGADAVRKMAAEGWDVAVMSSSGKGEALAMNWAGWGLPGPTWSLPIWKVSSPRRWTVLAASIQ